MAQEQRDFHIEAVVGYRFTPTLKRALDPIFHRVDMQVQFVGGGLEAGPVCRNSLSVSRIRSSLSVAEARGPRTSPTHVRVCTRSAQKLGGQHEAGIAVHSDRRRMRFRGEYDGSRRQRLLM